MAIKQHCDVCDRVVEREKLQSNREFNGFGVVIPRRTRDEYQREDVVIVVQSDEGEHLDVCAECVRRALQTRVLERPKKDRPDYVADGLAAIHRNPGGDF